MREMLDARRLQVLASALRDLVGIEHQIGAVCLWTMIHGRFSGSDAHLSYSASSICHIQRLREHHPRVDNARSSVAWTRSLGATLWSLASLREHAYHQTCV